VTIRDSGGNAGRRYDRLIVVGLLIIVSALAWAHTIHQRQVMAAMDAAMWRDMNMSMNGMEPSWTANDMLLVFVMWVAMMAAMMAPGAGPMIGAFATINRRRRERSAPYVATTIFMLGYLLVWAAFSLVTVALQWALQMTGFLTTMLEATSYWFSAALFLAAGLYQFSPLKERCLTYCRSTDGFILSEWRDGTSGAIVMGMRHGLFCVLCCAGLMLLLFAVAVMDLRWVAGLAILVTAEKLLPHPKFWRVGIGVGFITAGASFASAAVFITR
jgi:predicted metal-binding membrane protein